MSAALGCAMAGCTTRPTEQTFDHSSAAAFAGEWRSVTPSYEFIELSVTSKSSEQGALAARLTLSGVAWEGGGRITGDSLSADMAITGAPSPSGTLVAHARDVRTLLVHFRPATASPLDLTFVCKD